MRKRRQDVIAEIEKRYKKPARQTFIEAIERHESLTLAAESLGLTMGTFYYLLPRLGIQTKTITKIAS